jgi:Fe-S cluster assembly protein SufB
MDSTTDTIESFVKSEYKYGFVSDIETDAFPPGLSEDGGAPHCPGQGRAGFHAGLAPQGLPPLADHEEPHWPNVHYPPLIIRTTFITPRPSRRKNWAAWTRWTRKVRKTFAKLGISLDEQKRLSGVAVDAVLDSVSVATTFKEELAKVRRHFLLFQRGGQNHPDLVKKYLGTVVPANDNFFAALNSAVFSDGSFCYMPKGVRCPMELSTYFRINTANTGQFERTLIIADEGSYVSYLEGCTAPMRDSNQLHAAVVELIALENAEIKYSTVQNWYPGDKEGKGGIYNFVTKRGKCAGRNSKISWTQVETGSAITWKYPSVLLLGDNSVGEFYSVALTNHRQQADTGTKMIHVGKNTTSTIVSKGISAGRGQNSYRGLVKIRPSAATRAIIRSAIRCCWATDAARTLSPTGGAQQHGTVEHEASTPRSARTRFFIATSAASPPRTPST